MASPIFPAPTSATRLLWRCLSAMIMPSAGARTPSARCPRRFFPCPRRPESVFLGRNRIVMQLTTDAKPKQRLPGLCMLFAALRYDTDMHSSQRSQDSSLYRPVETRAALAQLWQAAGQPAEALSHIRLTGTEPVLPSSFAVGTAAQASIAASALAAAELWHLRCGRHQLVTVDMRHAAIEFRSERYLRVDGQAPSDVWDKIAGIYRCGDGRWVRLHT